MLRKPLFIFCCLVLLNIFAGCAGPKPAGTPLVAPGELASEELNTTERFRKYASIGIRPFMVDDAALLSTNSDERRETESFVKTAPGYLIKGFMSEMKGGYYRRFGEVRSDSEVNDYDLVIDGRFIEFDRGNRAARYWGTGGWTRAVVSGTMTETATGKVVVKFRDTKEGKGGSFGGDSMDLLRDNCVELGGNLPDFLEEVY